MKSLKKLLDNAHKRIEDASIELEISEETELISASAVPAYNGLMDNDSRKDEESDSNKFSEVERRLREELAAFKLK